MFSDVDNILSPTLNRLHKRIGVNNNFVILCKGGIDILAREDHPRNDGEKRNFSNAKSRVSIRQTAQYIEKPNSIMIECSARPMNEIFARHKV